MKAKLIGLVLVLVVSFTGFSQDVKTTEAHGNGSFNYLTEQFADLKIFRYQVPGFDNLTLKQKQLCYYLSKAAASGRDIIWDQNYKHNLCVRRTLEAIIHADKLDKTGDDYAQFMEYTKRVWFSNGVHHHYSNDKFIAGFSLEYFIDNINAVDPATLPLQEGETVKDLTVKLIAVLFDENVDKKRVNLDPSVDMVANSATNFYEGVTQKEVEDFYSAMIDKDSKTPISYGLNSKVMKEDGKIVEKKWYIDGMYGEAIKEIVYWLEKAATVAENKQQKLTLEKLAIYYRTGDLKDFDAYSVEWVKDVNSVVDVVNGFIEVYGDPMGYKGSFESVVSIKDMEASKRIAAISKEAQWFEDNSPIMDEHKKANVVGITAKVINVVQESGDASPSTPIGINLPNANWIRATVGSKSVNLGNIVHAYEAGSVGGPGVGSTLTEFAFSEEEIGLTKKYSSEADNLHTDMHEVIGHASGKINPGIGTPKETLKNYSSTLEEARADLVGLYYIYDTKLVEMGVMSHIDAGKSQYNDYIRNGMMTQLTRLKLGDVIEEAHMRNRALVARWAFEKGAADKVIEQVKKDGKTYFVVNDYEKLRVLFGELLKEIQRIKSEGDYAAGKALVENYGVQVDLVLHAEVLERFAKLNIAPYGGFINADYELIMKKDKIKDVKAVYPDNFTEQMLKYGKEYNFLPTYN